jgi:hypothetical protein
MGPRFVARPASKEGLLQHRLSKRLEPWNGFSFGSSATCVTGGALTLLEAGAVLNFLDAGGKQ